MDVIARWAEFFVVVIFVDASVISFYLNVAQPHIFSLTQTSGAGSVIGRNHLPLKREDLAILTRSVIESQCWSVCPLPMRFVEASPLARKSHDQFKANNFKSYLYFVNKNKIKKKFPRPFQKKIGPPS